MKTMKSAKILVCALALGAALAGVTTTAQAADAAAGKALYETKHAGNKYAVAAGVGSAGCISCHGNPRNNTKHIKTGKISGPMAVSSGWKDPKSGLTRYKDARKVAKWFKRNCNGVLGRECTQAEKDNFLAYMATQ